MNYNQDEFLICTIASLLETSRHVAVGMASPFPGSAALLVREETKNQIDGLRLSMIGGDANNPFTDGGRELFDCSGQGRIDTFFLGGVQIDGQANINLVGTGDYPKTDRRFPGSFGSAYMYFVVPKVILFRPEHTRRVFVPEVDFISAPGTSEDGVYRPGGPHALVTELCLMMFNRERKRFQLTSVHPGHTVEEIQDNTGFDFDIPETVPETLGPTDQRLRLLRTQISPEIAKTYPEFVARVFETTV
ncbi:MAG: CoA synthetase [Alphaproteobacteria bacterium]|nr:CoA synthetase [Alphaproteobacteria bacterium]